MGESGMRFLGYVVAISAFGAAISAVPALAGKDLDGIKSRNVVRCGVGPGTPGFHFPDSGGKWSGFNVDFCKALAAAVLGNPDAIELQPLTNEQRNPALQTGQVDVLLMNVTRTYSRSTQVGFHFAPTIFYDGQGLMVAKSVGAKSIKDLDGATICVKPSTTTELSLADTFRKLGLKYTPVNITEQAEINKAFTGGRCDVMTDDSTELAAHRSTFQNAADYEILPERLSKEPLSPAVRYGDDHWYEIVDWTVNALVQAEEFGITQANLEEMKKSSDPQVLRFLGVEPGYGEMAGLKEGWIAEVVKAVGNYGEIFDRHLGKESSFNFARGQNALWTEGGLIYSAPFR
jgi:general L-amino acid transport system substrate-binding protein